MDFNAMQEMQSRQQRFEKAKYEARTKTPFALQQVKPDWLITALMALQYASPLTSGLSPDDFNYLAAIRPGATDAISLFAMGALCNNIESCSAHQLGITVAEYAQLLNETATYAEMWNKQDAELMKKVHADFEEGENAKRKALQSAAGNTPMKAIKAEA